MSKKFNKINNTSINTNTNINTNANTSTQVIYKSENELPEIIKTISFTAFLQGNEKNDFRAWTRHSEVNNPMIDEELIPALSKHMNELVKGLGKLLPRNPFKRGIQILDKDQGTILTNEHLLVVKIECRFVETYGEITSEKIAYAVKDMNPNFKPDRHLIALQLDNDDFPCPINDSAYFEGCKDYGFWNVYVKKGECRHFFKEADQKDADGNSIFEDSGMLEFPEKSAWEYLDDKKRVKGNSQIVDFLRELYKKEEIPTPVVETKETKKFIAKGKKDQLGSIGDNVQIKKNIKKVSK